ncbi:GGDEF domain-containing protein [Saccharibacillus alkalitolerans]|uniref:GGDEF domain-containing protein n=1 Tax=Saccharibacillus alkalitolerans TaxID=2705290 RepID=A0ABX0F609_9BACL|nr:GGDEF domain-containing protein [Saccharibacillus alkalitolerans]NGZ76388.1 GGDEF domain-containing protein [Saccharibacillus alkalitolerans]
MTHKTGSPSLSRLIRRSMNASTLFTILVFAVIVTILLSVVIRPLAQLGAQLVAHSTMREMTSPAFPENHGIDRLEDLSPAATGFERWWKTVERQEVVNYRIPLIDGDEPLVYDEGREMPRALHTVDIVVELGGKELYRSAYLPSAGTARAALEERNWLYEYFNKPYYAPILSDGGEEIGLITARIYPPLLVRIVGVTAVLMLLLGLLCFYVNYLLGRWLIGPLLRSMAQLRGVFRRLADGDVDELFEKGIRMDRSYSEIEEIAVEAGRIIDNTKMYMEQLKEKNEELEAQKKVLTRQATIDSLTGLVNRRYFVEQVVGRLDEPGLMLMLLDIDDFKRVNDTYGHAAGDLILEGFASVLDAGFGGEALTSRFGGEEFAVFITRLTEEEMLAGAERLRAAIEASTFDLPGSRSIGVTSSIGIAYTDPRGLNFEELYQQADAALYVSKRGGKNRVTVFGDASPPQAPTGD